jgi:hypothetical protein
VIAKSEILIFATLVMKIRTAALPSGYNRSTTSYDIMKASLLLSKM